MEKKLTIGESDKEPQIGGNSEDKDIEEGSMLMGPGHPVFRKGGIGAGIKRDDDKMISVPPGARFDPITPEDVSGLLSSGSGMPKHLSGEPDQDELLPPNLTLSPPKKKNPFGGFGRFGDSGSGRAGSGGGPFDQRF